MIPCFGLHLLAGFLRKASLIGKAHAAARWEFGSLPVLFRVVHLNLCLIGREFGLLREVVVDVDGALGHPDVVGHAIIIVERLHELGGVLTRA